MEPAVVGPEARRPHDRPDLTAAKIQLKPGRIRDPGRLRLSAHTLRGVAAQFSASDLVQSALVLENAAAAGK